MEYNKLQKHIAFRIRECRKAQGLSQEKLSEIAGLGVKAIQNIVGSYGRLSRNKCR